MSTSELTDLLDHLRDLDMENEVVEFKEAKNDFDFRKLGRYFSALSNEANLKKVKSAWLVFGVEDKKHKIVGTQYRSERRSLDRLKGEIANKIRNLKYRYLQGESLFPEEMSQYEPYSIREALNNSIAHQDYAKHGRINVVEMPDQLIFTNLGEFIPGSVENVINDNAPEEEYRNPFLANAMFNLKMVDTIGSGIRKMFLFQRDRYFPMPEYDLSGGKVELTLIGKVINEDYAALLARRKDLTLNDVILLDRIQKKKAISKGDEKYLRQKKLIEGRRPNYFLSIDVSQKMEQKADYSKNKGFEKQYYLDLILKAINEHGSMTRRDIDELLWNKLPEWMTEEQKKNKVMNLITELRKNQIIENKGTSFNSNWIFKRPLRDL